MAYLNIDVDDFTYTPSHKWGNRLTFSLKAVSEMLGVPYQPCMLYVILVSWLLNPHPYFFFVMLLELCVFPLRVRLESLGYASDFKNSKKSVRPYVSGFRFLFPPYGHLFSRSVPLQYRQHLFSPFRSYCTPWQPSNS